MGRIDRGGGDGGEPARSPPIFRQSSLLNLDRCGCAVCLAADMAKISIGVSGVPCISGAPPEASERLRDAEASPLTRWMDSALAMTARRPIQPAPSFAVSLRALGPNADRKVRIGSLMLMRPFSGFRNATLWVSPSPVHSTTLP